MNRTIELKFITPLFSHGAMDVPEIRPPSIRGQLHDWFRLLGGDIVAERRVFGGIRQTKARYESHDRTLSSSVVVRVSDVRGNVVDSQTLPHKSGGAASLRRAFAAGTTCRVLVLDRLRGLSSEDERRLSAAIDAWLLMGTLGYRATRAGGSFSWHDEGFTQPTTRLEYEDACRNLLDEFSVKAKVAVLSKPYETAERARKTVSDSLGGKDRNGKQDDLERLRYPLGRVSDGRKTSSLRYRIVRLKTGYHVVAFWDNRSAVTGNTVNEFYGVVDLLARKKPELGKQLQEAF